MRLRDLKVDRAGNRKVSICQASFSRHRFARTCCRCNRPRTCLRRRRTGLRPARRSTRRSTIPTNFFTAAGLDSRASDINNLLDGIGNGVQVLQAANTGITSLQKLVDTAKSIANQALQIPVGYNAKSSFTTPINPGATADNLLGTAAKLDNTVCRHRREQQECGCPSPAPRCCRAAAADQLDRHQLRGQRHHHRQRSEPDFRASARRAPTRSTSRDSVATLLCEDRCALGRRPARPSTRQRRSARSRCTRVPRPICRSRARTRPRSPASAWARR